MKTRAQVTRFALLLVIAVVLLNVVGSRFRFRWDFTSDHRYTLSAATKSLLKDLPQSVTITAYFTADLPSQLELTKNDFKDMLVEYAQRSGGRVQFEFKNPNASDAGEKDANEAGVHPQNVQVLDKDKASVMRAYMGAVVKMGESTAIIPVVKSGSGMEWTLSSSIKQVSYPERPVLGFVQGHGEPSMESMPQALRGLEILHTVQHFAFFDSLPIHERFASLLMVEPRDSFPQSHLYWLDHYLQQGHGVVICLGSVKNDLASTPVLEARTTALTQWLAGHGVSVRPQIAVDKNCGAINVMQQRSGFNMQTQIPFPYFPIISTFADHPVSAGLDGLMMRFCSPVEYTGDSTMRWTPLLMTSDHSNALASPVTINADKQWTDMDFPEQHLVLGGALEGPFAPGAKPARLVVFTSGDFAVNGTGGQMAEVNPDNINLLVNAVDWIGDNTGLIELRNRSVTYRPLEETTDGKRNLVKWVNLVLPVFGVVLFGLLRARWRRRQRTQRMQPGHVQ